MIEESFAANFIPYVTNFLNNPGRINTGRKPESFIQFYNGYDSRRDIERIQDAPEGSVAVINITGANRWSIIFCLVCMPLASVLTYFTMKVFSFSLPTKVIIPYKEIPLMIVLYFLGAIPEEFGWTSTLTEPLTKEYGPIKAGIIIGGVWGVWHVIPWSWVHPVGWIAGMCLLNVLMRTAMIYAYVYGGKSLFTGLVFHTMINVTMGIFLNYGSHINTWIFSVWMAIILLSLIYFIKRESKASKC